MEIRQWNYQNIDKRNISVFNLLIKSVGVQWDIGAFFLVRTRHVCFFFAFTFVVISFVFLLLNAQFWKEAKNKWKKGLQNKEQKFI